MEHGIKRWWRLLLSVLTLSGLLLGSCSGNRASINPETLNDLFSAPPDNAAIEKARILARNHSRSAEAWLAYGRLVARRGDDTRKAEGALKRVLTLADSDSPLRAWAEAELGRLAFRAGRSEEGRRHCKTAISIGVDDGAVATARMLLHRYRLDDRMYSGWLERKSEHFRFHWPELLKIPQGDSVLTAGYEKTYASQLAFWKHAPEGMIDVYLYAPESLEAYTGLSVHHAFPERCEIHTSPYATYGHELTHLFAQAHGPAQVQPLIMEGIAVALDETNEPAHYDTVAARSPLKNPKSIIEINTRFGRIDNYAIAASFVTFLIRKWGKDKFLILYRKGEPLKEALEETYEIPWAEMDKVWRNHLQRSAEIPKAEAQARKLFFQASQLFGERDRGGSKNSSWKSGFRKHIEWLEQCMERYGETMEWLYYIARSALFIGNLEKTEEAFNRMLDRKNDPLVPAHYIALAWKGLAEVAGSRGDMEKALFYRNKAVETDIDGRVARQAIKVTDHYNKRKIQSKDEESQ